MMKRTACRIDLLGGLDRTISISSIKRGSGNTHNLGITIDPGEMFTLADPFLH